MVIVRRDGSVSVLHEKGLSAKLELLYSKSLFLVALNLAQSEKVSHYLTAPSRTVPALSHTDSLAPLRIASIVSECLRWSDVCAKG